MIDPLEWLKKFDNTKADKNLAEEERTSCLYTRSYNINDCDLDYYFSGEGPSTLTKKMFQFNEQHFELSFDTLDDDIDADNVASYKNNIDKNCIDQITNVNLDCDKIMNCNINVV